jgi:protein arginine kinase
MVETLLDKPVHWLNGDGPEAIAVLCSRGVLRRNLSDLPFPHRCSEDEKRTAEERVLQALDQAGLMSEGTYVSLLEVEAREARFLAERNLVTPSLIRASGPRGVYLSEDQGLSVMINECDHLRIHALDSGYQLNEVWNRLNRIDEALAEGLDYAFDEHTGYLTSALDDLGTALRASAVLHLPSLNSGQQIPLLSQQASEEHHRIEPVFGDGGTVWGDFFALSNRATLGLSEEEVIYHVRAKAKDLIEKEQAACATLREESPHGIHDRIGRALGLARGAHLLSFDEAVEILSSLRLGAALGLPQAVSIQTLNEVLLAAQPAHLEMRLGRNCDDLTLNVERADLFRARFA